MYKYEIVTNDINEQMLTRTEGDHIVWIPMHPANKDYVEYLRYTEWVEAGNNPEDFWTRDLDSPEGLEQVSEPKEEGES